MTDATPRLSLPLLAAAQAQKHVTHNEALVLLDRLVHLVAADLRDAPPVAPADGAAYLVGPAATGAFAGHAGALATFTDGAWRFDAPAPGWLCWLEAEAASVIYDGTAWRDLKPRSADRLGIGTMADATNRLAVASPAVLLGHAGSDVRVKINKAAAGDTASLLFQTGYAGRAEIGTTGDDKLHVKVSADGATGSEALVVDPSTGRVGIGTAMPGNVLQVNAASGAGGLAIVGDGVAAQATAFTYGTSFPAFNGRRARGSLAAPAAVAAGDILMRFGAGGHGATAMWGSNSATVQVTATEAWSDTNRGAQIELSTIAEGAGQSLLPRLVVSAAGHSQPGADNAYTLGTASARWSAVWSATGVIQTSDARDKQVIGPLPFAAAMVDAVDPVLFRWRIGGTRIEPSPDETEIDADGETVATGVPVHRPGARAHAGFLAQDLKAALDATGIDFGAWGLEDRDDADSRQWTRPDQLVAVLWAALRQTRAEVAALREGAGAVSAKVDANGSH
ncbi:DUF2793 domain-containing protein [Phreatobacter sp.]|uniref:DUF2793 domain-containing protein n=1 Tax=Phreatobacter sp. TaxID=1966341 RepID=UPI0022CBE40E|nr:DUF2793 domain-containing protein [Phreatobacter sp.]MCZ8314950.1 DUF2793 domain-containing protein [Phreatobacter sp.]